jgi:hypothetical protein
MRALGPDHGEDSTAPRFVPVVLEDGTRPFSRASKSNLAALYHQLKPTAEELAERRRWGLAGPSRHDRRAAAAAGKKWRKRRSRPLRQPLGPRLRAKLVAALAPLGVKPADIGVGFGGGRISFANIPHARHHDARCILTGILGRRFLSPERRQARIVALARAARREARALTSPRRMCHRARSSCCSRSRAAAGGGGGGAGDDDGAGDDSGVVLCSAGWRS